MNPRSPVNGAALTLATTDHLRWATKTSLAGMAGIAGLLLVGIPPVDVHGPLHHLGIMDPLCGGTRAMFLLITGQPGRAATYNPLVFPLAASLIVLWLRTAAGYLTSRWVDIHPPPPVRRVLLTVGVAAVLALQIRQQALADLLTQPWPR